MVTAGISTQSRAATVSVIQDTPTNLLFTFSGTGFNDLINGLPAITSLVFWRIGAEHRSIAGQTGLYGFGLDVRHGNVGPSVFLGVDDFSVPLGTLASNSQTVAHDGVFDFYTLNITVNNNGSNQWGTFSGSVSAVHRAANIPDAGSTAGLLGSALAFLLVSWRRLR